MGMEKLSGKSPEMAECKFGKPSGSAVEDIPNGLVLE
jgi:hypothetical protein